MRHKMNENERMNLMKKIEQIEGIGEVYRTKLNEAGIVSVEQYLEACKTKKDRKALAEKTGISVAEITKPEYIEKYWPKDK